MQYITGIHALNIHTMPDVCGDWHRGALNWRKVHWQESDQSVWGDYGIIKSRFVYELNQVCNVANTIRALLDIIANQQFFYAQGMKNDYICNEKYTNEIFEKVLMLRSQANWDAIDAFMQSEYRMRWVRYVGVR